LSDYRPDQPDVSTPRGPRPLA